MNKFQIIKLLRENNDSIIDIAGNDSICATIDFSSKYIKNKRLQRRSITKNSILVFSWTDDNFRNIEVKSVKKIIPLSNILNNESPEIIVDGQED